MQWFAQAPSNIALIKYMGKKDEANNIPSNPSLSYTLQHLVSNVMLETVTGHKDFWEPLEIPGGSSFQLSSREQGRFLKHLARIKEYFQYTDGFIVRSSNNFPSSSGLASSASSFAALTKCAFLALSELTDRQTPTIAEQARLSRLGSGSSCRSFFAPWALWQEDQVTSINIEYNNLIHQAIIISHGEKAVPSTEAHQRVPTSNYYPTRGERATQNLQELLLAFKAHDWHQAYQICWREFQDLHNLFTSSAIPFSYMTAASEQVLATVQNLWQEQKDGPLVTMDAGPNIHLLYRADQAELALQFKQQYLVGNYDVL